MAWSIWLGGQRLAVIVAVLEFLHAPALDGLGDDGDGLVAGLRRSGPAKISSQLWPSMTFTSKPNAWSLACIVSADCCWRDVIALALAVAVEDGHARTVSLWSTMKSSASQICPSRLSPSPMMQ